MSKFTHIDDEGRVRMVDVTAKKPTVRTAVAGGMIYMNPETF
ncbi:MAG: cyclic pyranopterin monophosphate synthase MoaC, partial [Desulfobacterales bacterium]|nr:cyclic pyranopterin monophosphate synthase MoaC [Desulfobacterales bacterium]